ncbi:MAG: ribose-5-phosphate isomerase RpiA [Deltaproteobacteria bacterium]|nr:ribose-5-phosphate isomerase RpiA [Deltaproteobacteria bacterium]
MDERSLLKERAARKAVEFIESGMVVGLGTGSTVRYALDRLGEKIRAGELKDIVGIPSSRDTEKRAREAGIPLTTLEECRIIDITIDGADEVDPSLNLIKGGGGALLREKVIAQTSRRTVIMVDESKMSPCIGTLWHLPVEVIPFAWPVEKAFIETLGAGVTLRKAGDERTFETDQGNYILDCRFGPIKEAEKLALELCKRAGIVEHGLFLGLASDVVVAGKDGIRHLKKGDLGGTPFFSRKVSKGN